MTNAALAAANASRFAKAKLTRGPEFIPVAKRLFAAKSRYQAVEAKTGVPWYVIAVIHEREASQSWTKQLAQGDPLSNVSTHVPKGRGPFKTWEDGAYDALVNCAPYAARNNDWSIGSMLAMLEAYNGLGYYNKGLPSPYIWSGTDQYIKGKYVADGKFDANAVDKQLGCAGLLIEMRLLDPSIKLDGSAPTASTTPTLRRGATGADVKTLQKALNANGLVVIEDGIFGASTESAVKLFQTANNLVSDGVCGTATWTALSKTAKIVSVAAVPSTAPSITNPSPGSIGAWIKSKLWG